MIEFALDKRYDQSQFMAFLKTFLPDDYVQKEEEVDINFTSNFITSAMSLGTCKSIDLEVYVIEHTSLNDARVGLSKDTFRLLLDQSFHNRALVVFLPVEGDQWRLSLLQMEAEINDRTSRIQRSYSNPRRYSFLLGVDAHVKTPHQFLFEKGQIRERREGNKNLDKWDDLLSRFSVEVLTKKFYDDLFNWYTWAVDPKTGVYFPNNPETTDDDRDNIDVKIIRLITRLMFVWFIKQKQLVPEDIFKVDFVKTILKDFEPLSDDSSQYYNAILQNLFFATLNRPIIDDEGKTRDFRSNYSDNEKQPSNLYRYDDEFTIGKDGILQLFSNVPYLNAGLFECLDRTMTMDGVPAVYYDGFSSNVNKFKNGRYRQRAFIPNRLFFEPEKGLLDILNRYNFTVEENTPTDQQVALDPELLGKVFENLLGAYNPETQETARNSTGSFYTPREIVQYMVDESLIEHLKLHVGENLESEFRKLVSYTEEEFSFTEDEKQKILKAIYNCKVLDPACGSGAFPMGMLQQMVHIISRLDPENKLWKDIVLERALEDSKEAFKTESKEERQAKLNTIEETFDNAIENPDYTRKLYLIENCIYGVDIQPIAMMISKLRFFISLVCEQDKINLNDPQHNFGVNTLPNLETKFVAANTLLDADIRKYTNDWTQDDHLLKLKDELLAIRHRHFYAQKRSQKRRILEEDKAKRKEISDYIITSTAKPDDSVIKRDQDMIKADFLEMEKYREPKMGTTTRYTSLFGEPEVIMIDVNAQKRKDLLDHIKACEAEIRREENKKNPVGFEAAVKQVTDWNPYDQNASSPFLDIEWMFGMKDKFDIVIANPPYVDIKGMPRDEVRTYFDIYETTENRINLYAIFIERGIQLVNEETGILCYINPNSMLINESYTKLRKLLLNNIHMILKLPDSVFTAAVVETNIFMYLQNNSNRYVNGAYFKNDAPINFHEIGFRQFSRGLWGSDENVRFNIFSNEETLRLLKKISEGAKDLSEYVDTSLGITPYDKAKGHSVSLIKERRYHSKVQIDNTYVPLISGKNIFPYIITNDIDEYLRYGEWLGAPREERFFKEPHIVVRQIVGGPSLRIIAGLSLKPTYFTQIGFSLLTKNKDLSLLKYLTALLNSKLISFYHKNKFLDIEKVVFQKILIANAKKLPIKIADDIEPYVKIVDKILELKQQNSSVLNPLIETLDLYVFKLYGITYDEIKIIDPNMTLTKDDYDNISYKL